MASSPRDANRVPGVIGASTVTGSALPVGAIPITNVNPLTVAIVDGSGAQITSFGAGTQYTDGGVAPTHPVGPTLIWNNGGTWEVVSAAQPLPVTSSLSITTPSNATTTAYAASLVVKNAAGTLFRITGYNSKTSAQFIQVHDASSLPAEAAVPVIIFTVPASSNFSLDLGLAGRAFGTGIVICNSSTGPTKTIGSADCWFDAQFA